MRTFHGVLAAIAALLLVGQPASAESAQEILDRVKKRYDAINDAELKFTQHSTYQVSKLEQRISGTLFMKKKNKYRVEYTDRMVITDGVTVWSYNPAQKQVLIDNFKLDPHILTPEKLLTSAPQEFYATVIGTEKIGTTQTKVLKLVPKDDAAAVRSMKLWIDDATWLIKQVELTDTGGNRTVYTVSDIKVNVGIPDSRFTYQIPEGVEAVDLR
ncbi:MAG TPA: outer membrane lipoprotein chaperone LolA [Bacteroidota bacterium]|nr:outer membrane lipoprotein chaperone LolA [Bacteroidota bacterium]